ncbi:MAG TPA: hypothetical protein VIH45_07005 [Desulfuromonadaceae bacterium]
MKYYLYVSVILTVAFILYAPCPAAEIDMHFENGKRAAKEEIGKFVKGQTLAPHHQEMGFETQDDIDHAKIGMGFPVFTVDTDKMLDDTVPWDESFIIPTDRLYFIVVAGKKAITFLQMHFVDGTWAFAEMGGADRAKAVQRILMTWPVSSGYRYRYIRVYPIITDSIEISRGKTRIGIIPLSTLVDKPGKAIDSSDLQDPNEYWARFRPIIKKHIEGYRKMRQIRSK